MKNLLDCKSDVPRIDLHIHSTASDGTLTPAEILAAAQRSGLNAIAITDHDTLEGAATALRHGIPQGLHYITGVEISSAPPEIYARKGSFHILGYGIRLDCDALNTALAGLQHARKMRNPAIIERLNTLGVAITMADVAVFSGDGQIGRPHIAQALVAKGYAASIDEAFDRYIGVGQPAYVDKHRIPCRDAITLIQQAGGLSVLAHPGLLDPPADLGMETLVAHLAEMGLRGIEVYYPFHSAAQTRRFSAIADRLHLIKTGGTDFHGTITPGVRMGVADGTFQVPSSVLDRLTEALHP